MANLFAALARKVPQLINTSKPVFNNRNVIRCLSTSNTLFTTLIQQPAPPFEGMACHEDQFKTIKLSDYKGKYLLLMFYPLDFTFVCPTELIALEERYDDFVKFECEVIGISVDSHFTHLAWQNTPRTKGGLGKLRYPLLSDINKTISKSYSVLLEKEGIALRGMFIIDPNGIVRVQQINDLPIGRSIDEALRLIEAVRCVEAFGEVCPANWRPGNKTIKPDPKGSQEYFSSANK